MNYGRLEYMGDRWRLIGLPPHVAHRLKAMFLRIRKDETHIFVFPDTPENCADLDWFTQRYPVKIERGARVRLTKGRQRFERRRDEIEVILDGKRPREQVAFREGFAPYPFQHQAITVARRLGRLLLLDDVGLGKTVSALGTICDPQYLPAAVIVQAHLATQWRDKFVAKFTDLTAHIVKTVAPYDLPPADIYIFSYSKIIGWCDVAATDKFKSVVFDEIQELRHGIKTSKGKAARVFADRAQMRLGLSATPIYNYGTEAFPTIDLIAPGFLGDYGDFYREWCTGKLVKHPDALGTYLREHHVVLRRRDSDIGAELPPANILPVEVPYDEEVEADELEFARALAIKVTTGSFVERGQAGRELDAFARRITGLAKARHVAAYARILLEAGTPLMLAGWHRSVYERWLRDLAAFKPLMYTGSETARQKDKMRDAFVRGDSNLLIISLRSGSGLDGLQERCHTALIGELDWSPQVHHQLVGRLRRPGQKHQVDAIFLHADGGCDPLVLQVCGLKASQQRGIVDPERGVEEVHSDESRIKALAQLYLDKTAAREKAA
jgi:SNF2 family DNA or RNA helicase